MMRIAILSYIHGNRTAFEAVLADLQKTSPDLILHGANLAEAGARPVEIIDRIRDMGWPGVVGNTDDLIFRPESLIRVGASNDDHLSKSVEGKKLSIDDAAVRNIVLHQVNARRALRMR
jgi:predicted phosphodiesterase